MNTNENKVAGRASYTEDERRELILEFNSSGLTQAEFCRDWNINPKTFGRWLRAECQENEVSLCEVVLPSDRLRINELRICLPNGIEMALEMASIENLGSVLREAARCLG